LAPLMRNQRFEDALRLSQMTTLCLDGGRSGLKIEVFAISLLSIADQIVSVFPGKMRKFMI